MITNEVRWDSFTRDALPEALFGESGASHYGLQSFSRSELKHGQVALGFLKDILGTGYNPPSIIVLGEGSSREVFSWLKVYAPETSPLSQFARLVTDVDWDIFQPRSSYANMPTRPDSWACVVLGEVFSQGEGDADLSTIPLSRALACFTTAVARTAIIHGHDKATRIAVERLRMLETDRRFVRRSVMVADLLPAWEAIGAYLHRPTSAFEAADIVLDAARRFAPKSAYKGKGDFHLPSLSDFPGLTSDSVEERVLAFQQIASGMVSLGQQAPNSQLAQVTLAAAAFLVGRGTTHAFLLRRWSKVFPLAFAWFGTIAGLVGPRLWDPNWSRAVKGIERTLRAGFNWTDPPAADLCWSEFAWLASSFEGIDVFGDMPKMLPKVLSIEIAPGATCQLRLASATGSASDGDLRPQTEPSPRERELQAALAQFVGIATKVKHLLDPQSGSSSGIQQSLWQETDSLLDETTRTKQGKRSEPPRVWWRLQLLRRWSHEEVYEVFP